MLAAIITGQEFKQLVTYKPLLVKTINYYNFLMDIPVFT